MQFNIDDEIVVLGQLYADSGDAELPAIHGACWALARVTGRPAEELVAYVLDHGRRLQFERQQRLGLTVPSALAAPVPPPVAAPVPPPVAAPNFLTTPTVTAPPPPDGAPLGVYPGLGPITQLAVEPPEADLTKPPAPPSTDSLTHLSDLAAATGSPAALPMDAETLAAVDAEIEAARERARVEGAPILPPPVIPTP